MAENSVFFEAVLAARSVLLDDETALEGATTVSLETQPDLVNSDVLTYIETNFPNFMRNLRFLSKEDQELLLGYYVLGKTQTALALLHHSTQTLCSTLIRLALKKMATFIQMGPPTAATLKPIFEDANVENLLAVPLSEVVELYAETRSFQKVAEVLNLHRPDVRRQMSTASKTLSKSSNMRQQAVGAYLAGLIEKASASGRGLSRRKLAKQGNFYIKTPKILGEFRIDVTDPDFDQIFVSRANR